VIIIAAQPIGNFKDLKRIQLEISQTTNYERNYKNTKPPDYAIIGGAIFRISLACADFQPAKSIQCPMRF